jgi:hypothetical protein
MIESVSSTSRGASSESFLKINKPHSYVGNSGIVYLNKYLTMLKNGWPILLSLILLTSCNFVTRKEALYLNNAIVTLNDTIYLRGHQFGALLDQCYKAKDYSSMKPFCAGFENYLDSGRQKIIRLKDAGGSEELKNSEIELLAYEKSMIVKDFVPFEGLTPVATGVEINALLARIKNDGIGEANRMEKLRKLQEEYAARNGFRLRKNVVSDGKQ